VCRVLWIVGVVGAEALDVGEGEEVRECGHAAHPHYAAGRCEEWREPVREQVVAEDICCEDLAQRRSFSFTCLKTFLLCQRADV